MKTIAIDAQTGGFVPEPKKLFQFINTFPQDFGRESEINNPSSSVLSTDHTTQVSHNSTESTSMHRRRRIISEAQLLKQKSVINENDMIEVVQRIKRLAFYKNIQDKEPNVIEDTYCEQWTSSNGMGLDLVDLANNSKFPVPAQHEFRVRFSIVLLTVWRHSHL